MCYLYFGISEVLTVTLQRQLDVAQRSAVLEQVSSGLGQDVVGLGGLEKELQLHPVLPRARNHPRAGLLLLVHVRWSH